MESPFVLPPGWSGNYFSLCAFKVLFFIGYVSINICMCGLMFNYRKSAGRFEVVLAIIAVLSRISD